MARSKRVKFRPPQCLKLGRGNVDLYEVMVSKFWGSSNHELNQAITALVMWDQVMARKTYRIELKIDFADNANHEIMVGIARQYARDLLSSAMLLQDKSPPAVALLSEDTFEGQEQIELLDPSQELHTP